MTAAPEDARPVLISGGAGFIGANVAHRLLTEGTPVVLLDNLSRAGVSRNVDWLRREHGSNVMLQVADVRDAHAVSAAVERVAHVFHFAAQVAVTTSLERPTDDFDINARGTLNVLEAARKAPRPPSILFTSTNKVYGELADLDVREDAGRYVPTEERAASRGIGEDRALDFHSPYGCSKGAADQYVIDYARSFGLKAVVFRMSCIYGPHQFGTEDQGWVAHFLLRAMAGEPITLYGDGKQVRDVLFVDDLVDAMLIARSRIDELAGHAFNVGGGVANTVSLLELIDAIETLTRRRPTLGFDAWRTGDQRWYVSDHAKLTRMTGWVPRVSPVEGLRRLHAWLAAAVDRPLGGRPSMEASA